MLELGSLVSFVAAGFGAALLVFSNMMYYSRTKDLEYWRRFWLGKDLLTPLEYRLNRAGFWLVILGLFGMLCILAAFFEFIMGIQTY